jgi:starvation-inducible outer membrane lipoprotein
MRPTMFAAVLALAACAPQPKTVTVHSRTHSFVDEDSDEEEPVCKDERMTGTNMSKVVCRTPTEIAEQRAAAQEWEKHPRNDQGPFKKK